MRYLTDVLDHEPFSVQSRGRRPGQAKWGEEVRYGMMQMIAYAPMVSILRLSFVSPG